MDEGNRKCQSLRVQMHPERIEFHRNLLFCCLTDRGETSLDDVDLLILLTLGDDAAGKIALFSVCSQNANVATIVLPSVRNASDMPGVEGFCCESC